MVMKKEKIVALASLSVLATVALVSCGGGNTEKKTKPGVFLYASAYEYTPPTGRTDDGAFKITGWRNTECLTYSVKNAENLKYGEQDVEITIKPNKPFFTLKRWVDDTWEPTGNSFRPYVGLGSPNNKYAYELAENVAWTFEEKSNPDKPFDEEYLITVKKEYFQRNIIISFESEDHPILVHKSDYYDEHTAVIPYQNASSPVETYITNFNALISRDAKLCDFSAPSKGYTVTYRAPNPDIGIEKKNVNDLISFDGWEETETFTVEENGETKTRFKNFEVRGYTGEVDEQGQPIYDVLTEYTKEVTDDKKVTVFTHIKKGIQYISFYIPWALVVNNDDNYSTKYDNIKIVFNRSIFKVDIDATFDSNKYGWGTAEYYKVFGPAQAPSISERFANGRFRINNETYTIDFYNNNSRSKDSAAYDLVYKERETYCNYGVSFFAKSGASNKPKITLNYEAYVNNEEESIKESVVFDTTTNPLKTDWRNDTFGAIDDKNYELEYWAENNGWTLVRFTNPDTNDSIRCELKADADNNPWDTYTYVYYLYPSDEEISYTLPNERIEADSIRIEVA